MKYIDRVEVKLPKAEETAKSFFLSCNARKKFVPDTEDHYKSHLKKAKHDLVRAEAEFRDGCWDWTIIKAYYSIHHAANTLLSKSRGLFSKDHSCLIVALKYWNLIDNSLFKEMAKIHERFSDVFSLDLTFQLRKISQYNVDEWENLSIEDAKLILDVAKRFVGFVEGKI